MGNKPTRCPECTGFKSRDGVRFVAHLKREHGYTDASARVQCPRCDRSFKDGVSFLSHLSLEHGFSTNQQQPSGISTNQQQPSESTEELRPPPSYNSIFVHQTPNNTPNYQVNARVYAMWKFAMWQYFPATIEAVLNDDSYQINWDDGDTTGRIVKGEHVALDRTPTDEQVRLGSIVLFPQGSYSAGEAQVTGGIRFHEGRITEKRRQGEEWRYSGQHTKGPNEGKSVNYSGYQQMFHDLTRSQLRLVNS